jgi:hypothetical protein
MQKSHAASFANPSIHHLDEPLQPDASPGYHAFALIGRETLFASHLTMFHMDEHAYQFIIEVELSEPARSALGKLQQDHPTDSFFIANAMPDESIGDAVDDPMTVAQLAARKRKAFIGNVFHGVPDVHVKKGWPWVGVKPALANVEIEIVRVVHFRQFVYALTPPPKLLYLLFCAGKEAHMANVQTRYPDFDHVLTLREAPSWLDETMLRAGVQVEIQDIPRIDPAGARARCANPLADGKPVVVRYRGEGERESLDVAYTSWFCTRIVNMGIEGGDPCEDCAARCGTPTPDAYFVKGAGR